MADQSDSENKNKKQEPVNPDLGDWSPDYFPVSAKPIFRRSLILLLSVAVLCFSVAYCSEEEEQAKPNNKPISNQDDISDDDTEVF